MGWGLCLVASPPRLPCFLELESSYPPASLNFPLSWRKKGRLLEEKRKEGYKRKIDILALNLEP
jgi:hypothetical protein